MKKFIIERKLPDADNKETKKLTPLSKDANPVILEPRKHEAKKENEIREDAMHGNFPVNRIEKIKTVIDAGTAVKKNKTLSNEDIMSALFW